MNIQKVLFYFQRLDEYIKPSIKHTKDQVEYEVYKVRNRYFCVILSLSILIHTILAILTYGTDNFQQNISLAGLGCGISFIFIMTLKKDPTIVGNLCVLALIAAHFSMFMGPQNAIIIGYTGPSVSLFCLLMTGKPKIALFVSLFQVGWNLYFQYILRDALKEMGEAFIEQSQHPLISSTIFCAGCMGVNVHLLSVTFRKNLEVSQKNQYNERHKALLLGFSHELRNIIQSLLGQVYLIKEELIKDQESLKHLKNAQYLGDQLVHQINNILDSSKVDVDELEIATRMESSLNLFPRIWEICSRMIQRETVNGSIRIDKRIPDEIRIDDHRLMQIMLNLMGNAVKFTAEGRIEIKIDWIENKSTIDDSDFRPQPFNSSNQVEEEVDDSDEQSAFDKEFNISFVDGNYTCIYQNNSQQGFLNNTSLSFINQTSPKSQSPKGILKIIFKDTGMGIQEDDLEKIFGLFTQSSDPNRKKLGTGIGLFITKHLVEKMGGQIKVFSRVGQGTAFIICIPIKETNYLENRNQVNYLKSNFSNQGVNILKNSFANQVEGIQGLKKINCLIVDDETFIRNFMDQVLKSIKIENRRQASNGFKAIEEYKLAHKEGKPINLITMDITMPDCNGKDAVKEIRKYEQENQMDPCKIIFVTGNICASESDECMDNEGEIRGDGFLRKPVSKNNLEQQIKQFFK